MKNIGMDIGQKYSEVCEIDDSGKVVAQARVPTSRSSLTRWFGHIEKASIVIEAGGSSPWVDRLLRGLGHEVVVVNPHRVKLIAQSTLKTDKIDAEILARMLRCDRALLRPVVHRCEGAQKIRAKLKVREVLIKSRTSCINSIRGTLRAFGYRLASGTSEKFPEKLSEANVPEDLKTILEPLCKTIEEINQKIRELDKWVSQEAESRPEAKRLQKIDGVGPQTALAFVLCIEDPNRFLISRNVGAYLGFRPRLRESSGTSHSGRISKAGDAGLRRLLEIGRAHV
jgi:transposase